MDLFDCHLHAIKKRDFEIYNQTSKANKWLNIRSIDIEELLKPYDFEEFQDIENMYFLDSVNLNKVDIELKKVEEDLKKYQRIVGVKIYLGYQHYYANDERVEQVVLFAKEHNLTVTFHCGEIFNEDSESEFSPYSDAKYLEIFAKKYPEVNFVISHLNWSNFDSAFKLCNEYDNVYTDFSGCNDGETKEARVQQNLKIKEIIETYHKKYPKIYEKIMYGTDFFASCDEYNDVSSYLDLVNVLDIDNYQKNDIMNNNSLKAYPKMKQ